MKDSVLMQLIRNGAQVGTGGLWNTTSQGVAYPQPGRPALNGGLQQMAMLRAFQNGASMQQLQRMNPYTPRPTQFLPPPVPFYSWAADPNNPANQPKDDSGNGTGGVGFPVGGGNGADGQGGGGGPTAGAPGDNGLDGGNTIGGTGMDVGGGDGMGGGGGGGGGGK